MGLFAIKCRTEKKKENQMHTILIIRVVITNHNSNIKILHYSIDDGIKNKILTEICVKNNIILSKKDTEYTLPNWKYQRKYC